MSEQLDLLEWGESRPTAEVIDAVPAIAVRVWMRRFWPRPQNLSPEPIRIEQRRKSA